MTSTLAQAASAIRAAVKAAASNGTLPPYPDGITFRVRSERASLMTAITITVLNAPRAWACTGGGLAVSRPSPASLLLREALEKIAAEHYHADGQGSFITATIDHETMTGEG